MKPGELRELPDEELLSRLEIQKEELFNLRFQAATGQLDNSMRIKQVRHDVARILTVLRDRQTEEELAQAVARADRELKGRSLTEMAEEAQIEQEAASGATDVPEEEEAP